MTTWDNVEKVTVFEHPHLPDEIRDFIESRELRGDVSYVICASNQSSFVMGLAQHVAQRLCPEDCKLEMGEIYMERWAWFVVQDRSTTTRHGTSVPASSNQL